MKLSTLLLICLITIFATAYSQNLPRLQAIHNAADPGLDIVNVKVLVLGTPIIEIDSVAFRSALPFVQGVAIPVVVEISKLDGTVVLTIPITLENDKTYIGVVRGVENPAQFASNPNGLDISLGASLIDNGRETSTTPGEVEFILAHGVTDAPTIDLFIQGGSQLVDNLSFGDISAYVPLTPGQYVFDVTDETGTNIVASFQADLSAYADSALTVFASGFLDPSQNQNGEEFGLFAALPSGTVFPFKKVIVGIDDGINGHALTDYHLAQNYPNPFNPSTSIEFTIPKQEFVTLSIYDITGKLVQTLLKRQAAAGTHRIQWQPGNIPSGVYFYRLETEQFSAARKLMLLR